MNETNFFTKLAEVAAGGVDVTLRIKEKADRFTVQFLPEIANANKMKPLTVTGSPKDLDDGFFDHAIQAIEAAQGLKSNIDEVKQDAKDLAEVKAEEKVFVPKSRAPKEKASAKKRGVLGENAKELNKKVSDSKKKAGEKKKAAQKEKPAKKEKLPKAGKPQPSGPVVGDIFRQPAEELVWEPTDQEVDEALSKEGEESETE